MAKELKIGDPAPSFTCPANGGQTVSLSDFANRKLVIYFYPKDNTPGCTTEAIDFSRLAPDFRKAKATVLGCSRDTVAKHDKFVAKHDLAVRLLSDTDGKACEAYGVWVEKSMYGKKYMGIERATFLIDERGALRRAWCKVKVPGHVDEVLEAARNL